MVMPTETCHACDNNCILIKALSESERKILLQRATQVSYRKKEMLFKQGNFQTSLFLLKSGLVKTFMERRNEKNLILRIAVANEFINLPSFLQPTYEFSAITLCNSEVCIIPIDDVRQLLEKKAELSQLILTEYSRLSSFLLQRMVSVGTKQMHGRLADVILYLCSKDFENSNIFEYLSRKDIAEIAGMSVEGSIRLLTEFKNDGLINMNGKHITINNMELMQRLSEIG
ncbi:MAG TPA: Crp/Fnr family transcriptional regulator [Bacteroidales bacterium]|nr:Crp/Fnr family transcriptional regulator [Bacteroidales bacterium]